MFIPRAGRLWRAKLGRPATMSERKPKIFGAGVIVLDLVVGPDPDTPVGCWAGGTCGNVLSILAYLGWDAYPIARMNGDAASERVRADMEHWGVHLQWTECSPTTHTPIVVQNLRRGQDGLPKHRFSWVCPNCGERLPPVKMVTAEAAENIKPALADASVFFLDRLSRASLNLAAEAAARGAVVVFEPSGKASRGYMSEALAVAHIVKYADDRLDGIRGIMADGSAVLLEVQTRGARGLRYRHRFGRRVSDWSYLEAISAPRLADTCGAGDWCTAGLIAKAAGGGLEGLRKAGARGVRTALRYGQALASLNCGFEGARGAMYSVAKEEMERRVKRLVRGHVDEIEDTPLGDGWTHSVTCPACPPVPRGFGGTMSRRPTRVVR